MRHRRIKFEEGQSGFLHVYNRTVGSTGEYPFGRIEKEEFLRRITELNRYYAVEVLAVQVMGNHFHAMLYVPENAPSREEAAERYHQRYSRKRKLRPDSRACERLRHKLRDISAFMKDLEQPFSRWFNRTRVRRRRGHLWAERFKHTLLERGLAVWNCWKYIEMNPVRAGMVQDPADYRFCSFGMWCGLGQHPFAEALGRYVLPSLQGLLHVETLDDVKRELRAAFVRMKAEDIERRGTQPVPAIAAAAGREPFSTRVDRRVRYWVDGLVIGSEQFVRETMLKARGAAALERRHLTRALDSAGALTSLCCFKQLRVLLE